MKKTEKQIKAKEIGNKLLRVNTETKETKVYATGKWSGRSITEKYQICLINGIKWIVLSDLGYYVGNCVRKMKNDGEIEDFHLLHAMVLTPISRRNPQWKMKTLVNLNSVAAYKNAWAMDSEKVKAIIESAVNADVKTENFFTAEQMDENERLYAERCRLIAENKQEQEQHRREARLEQEQQTDKEEQPAEDNSVKSVALLAEKMAEIIGENQNLRKQVDTYKEMKTYWDKVSENNEKIISIQKDEIVTLKALCENVLGVNGGLVNTNKELANKLEQIVKLLGRKGNEDSK